MIDFHAHIFPDGMALQTVQKLAVCAGIEYHSDGTAQALADGMQAAGVTRAVNLPVATKPAQVRSINRWSVELGKKHPSLVPFGALHPSFPELREEAAFLRANGIRGIKLHPEYQGFYPDDPSCAPLYEACRDNGLIIVFHAGRDLAFTDVHGTPERFVPVAAIAGLKVVLAHMGGYRLWDGVEKHLVGTQAYLDTSVSYEMGAGRMRDMIRAHGAARVLFGTDSPWDNAGRLAGFIRGLELGAADECAIFEKNAVSLLEGI